MFLRRDERKGLVIPEDSKDDIADLVHDSTDSGHLGFRFALFRVVVFQHGVLWVAGAGRTNGLHGDDINHPSGVAGAALRESDISTDKIAGLFYRRVQAKVGIELLGTAKGVEIANFADQSDSTEEPTPPEWSGASESAS